MENYQVFISYRRDGGDALAGRVADRLSSLGYYVFYDVESMRSGTFNTQIFDAIDKCQDVVVVLPPNALDRCVNTDDWVRQELVYALSKGKNIIPLMMRGFEFPDTLIPELSALRYFEGVAASSEYFDAVIQKLVSMLKSQVSQKKIVDEILYITKQNNWNHSVQTSPSGSVAINYARINMTNLPKINLTIFVIDENCICVFARKIKKVADADLPKAYVLLNDLNKRAGYVKFTMVTYDDGTYIQATSDIYPAIANKAGICMQMLDEIARTVDQLYPEIEKTLGM